MSPGDELLTRLAERPFDRALRLVFADWLQEQGDPRGEVIALSGRGELSLTQRRRLQRVVERHAATWLGPLVAVAELTGSRWEGGFLDVLALTPAPAEAWQRVVGDPRLATVRALHVNTQKEPRAVLPFLLHPVLRSVAKLRLSSELLSVVGNARLPFTLASVGLVSWGTFGQELELLHGAEGLKAAQGLELVTSEFINPIVAAEVRGALLAHASGLQSFREVRLVARYGVMEGVAAWLLRGPDARRVEASLPRLERWGVDYGEVQFTFLRDGDTFTHLALDLSGDGPAGLDHRVALTASVLAMLGPAALTQIDARLPPGARLKASERDALRAAVRRLGTVSAFQLGDAPALP